jgi:hypothetical protein
MRLSIEKHNCTTLHSRFAWLILVRVLPPAAGTTEKAKASMPKRQTLQ